MAINLATKYSGKLAEVFTTNSFLAGKTSSDYSFEGVRSVRLYSILTQPLNDYNRTVSANRYGEPKELQDSVQELPMTRDRSFAITVDKGNNSEQMAVKNAGRVMNAQIKEQVVPECDKYALKIWAQKAQNVVAASGAPSKTTILGLLVSIETAFGNALVPTDSRYVAIGNSNIGFLRESLTNCDGITDRMLLKGLVGRFGTLNIVGIPDSWMPANAYALAWYQKAVMLPFKIRETNLHMDPPGISGHLLEGRYNYDAFVVGAKGMGVVVLTAAANKAATPAITRGASTTTITSSTSGAVILYTTDGSDPRYSMSAQIYSAAFTNPPVGAIVKAVAYNYTSDASPVYMSDLASATA